MFVALETSIRFLEKLVPVEEKIARRSLQLAKQINRASESISLNLGEGSCREGGDRRRHYEMARGSTGEMTVALRIARSKRYISAEEYESVESVLDRLRALMFGLVRKSR